MATLDCWRGKWALVTGASSGIGLAIVKELAAGGTNLVVTARRRQRLVKLRKELRSEYGIEAELVTADLREPDGVQQIFTFTEEHGIAIDLLVNNAGFGSYGEFRRSDPAVELGIVQVNCTAMVHLTRLYLPGMIARRSGGILIVSSTAAYQGVPYMATYAASKAFDLLFAEALAREVEGYGVKVCAVCPGPTSSEFHHVAGVPDEIVINMESPEQVAHLGLKALSDGDHSVISGFVNWIGVEIQRIAPRRLVTSAAEMLFRPPRQN